MRYCKFIFVIYVLLGSFLMVACSQDEDAKLAVNSNILKIEVVDSSIQQNGNVSRAVTDVTYKTTFSDGDAIGIFAVNSDKEVFIKMSLRRIMMEYGELTEDVFRVRKIWKP